MRTIIGKVPTESAPVDLAFFKIILDLAGSEMDVGQALGEQLAQMRQALLYPEQKALEGEVLPPARTLKAS
jgi:hypothetical protein